MSGDWRQRARERVGAQVDEDIRRYLAEEPLSEDDFYTALRTAQLEAAKSLDPAASLDEQLILRLISSALPQGILLIGTADPIVKPLQEMIGSVAGTKIQLGLRALSAGSTVLHLQPLYPSPAELPVGLPEALPNATEPGEAPQQGTTGEPPADVSGQVDGAVREVIGLMAAAEAGQELQGTPTTLAAFERFVSYLEDSDIEVDLGWHASSGIVRTGKITSRGRRLTREKMRPRVERHQETISGYVTELSASGRQGRIVVKATMAKNSGHRIDIDTEELLGLGLAFGQQVEMVINVEVATDPLTGRQGRSRKTFFSIMRQRRDDA